MNRSKLFIIIGIVLLVLGCYLPWMRIDDPAISITGMDTTGTRYGKPAIAHFILSACILIFAFIPKIWSQRFNLLFAALNLAWAARNFALIPSCDGGVCPQRMIGLYLVLFATIVILVATFFPKLPEKSVRTDD